MRAQGGGANVTATCAHNLLAQAAAQPSPQHARTTCQRRRRCNRHRNMRVQHISAGGGATMTETCARNLSAQAAAQPSSQHARTTCQRRRRHNRHRNMRAQPCERRRRHDGHRNMRAQLVSTGGGATVTTTCAHNWSPAVNRQPCFRREGLVEHCCKSEKIFFHVILFFSRK